MDMLGLLWNWFGSSQFTAETSKFGRFKVQIKPESVSLIHSFFIHHLLITRTRSITYYTSYWLMIVAEFETTPYVYQAYL